MNKQQYSDILRRKLNEESANKRLKAKNHPVYKDVEREIKRLEKQVNKLRKKQDKFVGYTDYNEIGAKINQFQCEWDNMNLIINNKKRKEEKIKILKKYKLYR